MKLVLNGGGVGKAVESARKLLNGIIDHNKKILYVPFAWPDPTFSGCLEFMTDELSDIDKAGIDMVNTPEELMGKDFCEYACLYFGGGNTYKLLGCLKTSGVYEKIRRYLLEDDGIVYGGSAGAIIFGKDLDSCNTDDENSVGLVDHTGFNMINGYSLLCHYTSREPERTEVSRRYLLELSKAKPIFAIPEEDTIYVDDDKIEFIGSRLYSVFTNGTEKRMYCDDAIELVPYANEDYEFVYEVKKNTYKKYVEECWGKWIEEDQRTYFEKFIRTVRNNSFIIMNGTEKIGFYNGEVSENGNYEIGNICIIPECQGKGVGTKILKEILAENKSRDIEIQYFKQNPVGTLYERLGFVPNGETEFHYKMIKRKQMRVAFTMEYKYPVAERSSIEMVPYSSKYQDKYKRIYNECYHEMREQLNIKPYDYIQDDTFFSAGMDSVYLLLESDEIIGSVAIKGEEIDDLIVNPKFQGKGYGKQLLLWALEHVNAERIILHVAEWNKRAVNLYTKNGFEIIETIPI